MSDWPGKQFNSDYQPKNRKGGRKPSQLRKFIKDNNLAAIDIQLIAKNIMAQDTEGLKDIIKNPKSPILMVGICTAMLKDMGRGKIDVISFLIERAFGKATEHVETSNLNTDYASLPKEERGEILKQLLRKYIDSNGVDLEANTDQMPGGADSSD